jgi:hypothetical protein
MTSLEMVPKPLRQTAGFLGCAMRPAQAFYHQFRVFFLVLQRDLTMVSPIFRFPTSLFRQELLGWGKIPTQGFCRQFSSFFLGLQPVSNLDSLYCRA